MRKLLLKMIVVAGVSWCLVLPALAMDMGNKAAEPSGMVMDSDMIMLKGAETDGVKASAHLKDIGKAMAEMGMDATHHLMVMFMDTTSHQVIDSGMVAVKVVDPSGERHEAKKMMGMGTGFGADITLKQKGAYTFEVGSKLSDGKKRSFAFTYTVD